MSQNTVIEPFGNNTEVPAGYPLTSSLDENNAQVGASAAAAYSLKRMIVGDSVDVNPNELTKQAVYIDVTNVRWLINYAQQHNLESVSYQLDGVEKIRITCNGSKSVTFAIVTDAAPVDNGPINFASGESLRTVAPGQSEEFQIPSDADMIVIDWYSDFVDNPFGFVAIGQEGAVEQMIDEKLAGGAGLKNRIIVAASNTPEELAATADIKCTGTNDEVALNLAIDNAISNGFSILLLRGDYYLDAPTKKYSSNNDTFLLIDTSPASGSSVSRSFCMEGENPASALRPTIHMSNTAYEALVSSTQYHLVGITDSTLYGGFVELKNITFQLPSNQKKVVCLDFLNYGGYARIHSIFCYGYTSGYNGQEITISNPPAVAVEGCVGIKFIGKGPNGSYGSEMTDCIISGFNEGICINTEWTVCIHVATIFCVTGWVFGKYTTGGIHAQCHPIVLICCGDERGVNLPYFYNSGLQNIDMIAFSIERNAQNTPGGVLGNYAMEQTQGSFRGRIDYTQGQSSNSTTARFWEYGHGHNMTTRNMAHAVSGSTSVRNGYAPNYMQRFYDETLGKEVICVNEQSKTWKDGAGNVV